jgi:hypothetical protein
MSKPKEQEYPEWLVGLATNDTVLQFWAEVSGAPTSGSPAQCAREVLETVRADEELLEKFKPEREQAKKLRSEIRASELKLKRADEERRSEIRQNIAAKTELLRDVESKCEERVFSDYERRALTLDLVHACWPQGHSVPAELDLLLKKALELADTHRVGGWMIYFKDKRGHVADKRGGETNMEHWFAASEIEQRYIAELDDRKRKELHPPKKLSAKLRAEALAKLEREFEAREADLKKSELTPQHRTRALCELRSKYTAKRDDLEGKGLPLTIAEFNEHVKPMSDYALAKEMSKRFGPEAPKRTTLRDWRNNPEYRANAYGDGVEPPEDAFCRLDSYEWGNGE